MHTSKRDPNRRGSALLAVMAMTVTIAMLSAIMLQQSVGHLRTQNGSVDKKQALYLAEAGLAEGLHSLRAGNSGNIGDEDVPAAFGDGAFWVETRENANGLFLIEATGIAGGARATLETIVEPVLEPISALGLVGFESVAIEPGARIGAYLSNRDQLELLLEDGGEDALLAYIKSLGIPMDSVIDAETGELLIALPGSAEPPYQLVVGSNGGITVAGAPKVATVIHGDLAPGPSSTVELGVGVEVSGSTAPRSTKLVQPEIEFPDLPLEPGFVMPPGSSFTVGPDARNFGGVVMSAGATLRIVGPATLMTRMLDVRPNARLEIDPTNGPVEVYTTQGFKFATGAELVNLAQDPGGLAMYAMGSADSDIDKDGIPDPPVTLPTSGPLQMQLFAPHTSVVLPPGQKFFGSVAAGQLTVSAGATVRYDNSLLAGDERDAALEIVSWQVLEIPAAVRQDLRADLVAELRRLAGGTLPRPAEAEKPVDYGVVYETPDGEERIYRGTLADFLAKNDGSEDDEIGVIKKVLDPMTPEDKEILDRERDIVAEVSK